MNITIFSNTTKMLSVFCISIALGCFPGTASSEVSFAEGSSQSRINRDYQLAQISIHGESAKNIFEHLAKNLTVKSCTIGMIDKYVIGRDMYCTKFKAKKTSPSYYSCQLNINLLVGEVTDSLEPSCPSPSIIGVRN